MPNSSVPRRRAPTSSSRSRRAAALAVNTVSADVRVQGVHGAQRLQSVSGDVRREAAAEDVECKTVSGNVTVTGSGQRGLLTITTVSGDAHVSRVAGEVNGNTVSGNFTIAMGDYGPLAAALDQRRPRHPGPARRGRAARLREHQRRHQPRPRGAGGAEFDVSSFNGDDPQLLRARSPVRTSEYAPGSELRFREGQGSARVRIKTLNGDISVCSK